jgi:hypothetical protein
MTPVKALAFACAVAAWPSLAYAQHLGGGAGFEPPLMRLAIGLILCTVIAFVAALALRQFMRTGRFAKAGDFLRPAQRKVRVLESHRISPHADVCVLACEDREYLVVVSPSGATVLRESAHAEPAP